MRILGIETSCDETAAVVLDEGFNILSSVVLSQDEVHAPFGGIVPELASRQHIKSISYIVCETLARAQIGLEDIDVVAATQGPGLIGSLLVGLSYAKGLAYSMNIPLVPIDHLESHVYSAFIENSDIAYPILALLVSGGHTSLYSLPKSLDFHLLAKTRDDAAGEALDKIAKFLDLGYPGGPVIDRLASQGNPERFAFSLPQMSDGSLDFSFSGFKTAGLRLIKELQLNRDHPDLVDFLAGFENSVIRFLLHNLDRAVQKTAPASLILCGGVARNSKLRKAFVAYAESQKLSAYIPSPSLCTDNAAMVAALAEEKIRLGLKPGLDLSINAYPRR
jgi:N6-L-threonylcarbamoyladenine synthase